MTPGERAVGRVERVVASRRKGERAPSRRPATSGTKLAATDAVVRALAATDVFGGLGVDALRRLALLFDSVTVSGGELLMRQGDDADALYVVVTGRLQATHQGDDGQRVLNDVVPGELVGELALVSRRPRAVSVQAVRDCELLRLPVSAFHRAVLRDPHTLLRLTERVVDRVNGNLNGAPLGAHGVHTVAVLPAGTTTAEDAAHFADILHTRLARLGQVESVDAASIDRALGRRASGSGSTARRNPELVAWLHQVEEANRFVIYRGDAEPTQWTTRCLRQADRVLFVADAARGPALGPVERLGMAVGRTELVLVHEASTPLPRGTRAWLEPRELRRHHHVREGNDADVDRVARSLAGAALGLVLGGGGPRGFAHLGVMQAIEELGIAVDAVGGTSMGALMGAMLALGWDAPTRQAKALALARRRFLFGLTLPLVAVSSSRKLTRILRSADYLDDVDLEDLWLPFFCVSANLSRDDMTVQERGPAWLALRASISMPGILPPVCVDGDLLVDGGVVNDVPADVMRERIDGPIVAVDLKPEVDLRVGAPFDPTVSGWRVLATRLNPLARSIDAPSPLEVVMRAKEVGGRRARKGVLESASVEVCLRPPTDGFDALDFDSGAALIDVGYRHTMSELAGPAGEHLPKVDRVETVAPRRPVVPVLPSRRGRRSIAVGFVWLTSLRDLQWRRRRFSIAALGTSLVFALTLLLSGFLASFDLEVDHSLDALGGDRWIVRAGAAGPFSGIAPVPADLGEGLAAGPGGRADPVITARHTIDGQPPLEVFVVGYRPGGVVAPKIVEGREPRAAGEAVVDRSTGVDLGGTFALADRSYQVVGRTSGLTVGGGLPDLFLLLEDAQALLFGGQPVATALLTSGDVQAPEGYTAVTRRDAEEDLLRPLEDTIESIKLFRLLLWIVAGAIVGSVVYLSALERARDFAVFKATGTSTLDLMAALALQAVALAVGAAVVAIFLARLLAPLFPAQVSFPARIVGLLPVIAALVGLAASTMGLRRAVRADPALAFGSGS